jgi:hypothetical protein
MASTRSSSKDSNQRSAAMPPVDTPTLATLMQALDRFKSDIQHDLQDVKSTISTTNVDIDTKVASVSSTLDTLRSTVDDNIQSLRFDLLGKLTTVSQHVDTAITSARADWRADIDTSLLSTREEFASTVQSIDCQLQDTNLKIDTMFETFNNKFTTLENLSISDPQVLSLLNDATLDHIRNLTLSPVIDEVISPAVAENIAPISKDLETLKPLSTSTSTNPKHKVSFAQSESKDFCVSKFTKKLERIKLQGDKLKDLELFWDSIQRALTNVCQVN